MSIVVAVAPGHDPGAAARVGALLATSYDVPLFLVAVSDDRPKLEDNADAEWARDVTTALSMADASIPRGQPARVLVRTSDSVRAALLEVCREVGADRLVIGSSDRAEPGRIELGTVAMSLLYSSPIPVVLVPRDASLAGARRVPRISAAYDGSGTSGELLLGARAVALDAGADFRVVSFAVMASPGSVAGVSQRMETDLMSEWSKDMRKRVKKVAKKAGIEAPETQMGIGFSWEEAIASATWLPGEVLMVGSSSFGPLARVSLGSQAGKIVKNAHLPVVLVPRNAQDAYAGQAD